MLTCKSGVRSGRAGSTPEPSEKSEVPRAKYSHIRVRVQTLDRLRAETRKLAEAIEADQTTRGETTCDAINPRTGPVTFDALLNYLLDEPIRKRRAAKESRERKRREKGGEK